MSHRFFGPIAGSCVRYAWPIIVASVLLSAGAAVYVARNFAINTNINELLSPDLPWRQHQTAYNDAFPQQATSILAVVTAPTPEFAGAAASALSSRLAAQPALFRAVTSESSGDFFARHQLLYLPQDQVAAQMGKLSRAVPLIRTLATDQSLRGLAHTLSLSLQGLQGGQYNLAAMAGTLNSVADTIEGVQSGKPTAFSWQTLVSGAPATPEQLRGLVDIWPVLDYHAIEPGKTATVAVRQAAVDAQLSSTYGATLSLTGTVPLADQQFATLQEGTTLNFIISGAIILIVLWLALRSVRIVFAVAVSLLIGLLITAALGLLLAGAFNPISVAFAVLFVGLGADFAIQFSVRYRATRHEYGALRPSLVRAEQRVGAPLTLAALAAAAGFLAFVPTDYRGIAELGLIAGTGMVVAYIASLTLLPALLWTVHPPGEPDPLGYQALASADRFLQRHRMAIVLVTSIIALAGVPFLFRLQFNFDPNSLQSQNAEPIATLRMLNSDPRFVFNAADVLTTPADAAPLRQRLSALPEVAGVKSIDDLVPSDQQAKLKTIAGAAGALEPALSAKAAPAPSDADDVAALRATAQQLRDVAAESGGPGAAAATRLGKVLDALAGGTVELRHKVAATFIAPLRISLQQLALSLRPQEVTRGNLPEDMTRQWIAQNGMERTQVLPKGNLQDTDTLRRFASAVLAVAPSATGEAIEVYEWGVTVTRAFIKAGIIALCSIAALLWLVLRRIRDVLVTLIPLAVAAAVTLEICGLTGFQLNYANIVALPALLGVGVAFKIYYVMAWRGGQADFLQSSLTRAVFFSALMTATAFGSLWLSSNPGISSMGKLLALSLACTLASAALFQPALMGPTRTPKLLTPPAGAND
jgi:uncharacterized protein